MPEWQDALNLAVRFDVQIMSHVLPGGFDHDLPFRKVEDGRFGMGVDIAVPTLPIRRVESMCDHGQDVLPTSTSDSRIAQRVYDEVHTGPRERTFLSQVVTGLFRVSCADPETYDPRNRWFHRSADAKRLRLGVARIVGDADVVEGGYPPVYRVGSHS